MGKRLRLLIITISVIWTLAVLYLLLSPGANKLEVLFFKGEDKIYHLIVFYIWSFFAFAAFNWKNNLQAIFWILSLGIILATSTELIQYYIPRRTPEFLDVFFDVFGNILGVYTGYLIKKELKR